MASEQDLAKGQALLREICGARLTSVQFVMDYLILGFDGKGALTTLVWPELLSEGNSASFGMAGYRDRLCDFITAVVQNIEVLIEQTITIIFEDKSRITLHCKHTAEMGSERYLALQEIGCSSGNSASTDFTPCIISCFARLGNPRP